MDRLNKRNKYFFGLGTIGRDMFYSFEANALLFFLSDILDLTPATFAAVSLVLSAMRIFDALNDPITGLIIDNIRSPWGKFKPAILVGGVLSAFSYLILFANLGTGATFVVIFAVAYLIWDISYGINDIGYWTLLPALTSDQKQRENIGAFARICANIGVYIIMVGWQPITKALGNTTTAWFGVAAAVTVIYLGCLCFPLFGVKEPKSSYAEDEEKTSLRQMVRVLFSNDQLLWVTLALSLFMVGYCTTVGFSMYYMKYLFKNEDLYPILAGVCGVAQLLALGVFSQFSKKMNRKQLYSFATILVIAGYAVFFFAELHIAMVVVAAVLLFFGQAIIQLLMMMFLTDTIEYGQWKLGKRNESITFSIQPLVNKIGGALSTAIIGATVLFSGIKTDSSATEEVAAIGANGQMIVKVSMFIIPVAMILAGYAIYLKKFKISEEFYSEILDDLKKRERV